jgi:nitrate/nitrite transporter NarK
MCLWFTTEQLPLAFSMLLFMVKIVRAVNDNTASIVYNHSHDLTKFFWIGLVVNVFSLAATIVLMQIHTFVIEEDTGTHESITSEKIKKQKVRISKDGKGNENEDDQKFTPEIMLSIAIYVMTYASLHAFYPNFSKFLQQNYGFTNNEAGHLSSIPYMLAAIMVPIVGHLLSFVSPRQYTSTLSLAMLCIMIAHASFLFLKHEVNDKGQLDTPWIVIPPIVAITVAHSLTSTIQVPLFNNYASNPKLMSKVMSLMKILEGLSISVTMYTTGHLR